MGAFPFPSDQGSQLLLAGTTRALVEAGHHVEIAAYAHGAGLMPAGLGETPVHRAPGVPGYRRMRSGPDVVKPVLDLRLARVVAEVLRDRPFDVVHAHNHEALLSCVVARSATRTRHFPALVYGQHTLMAEELPSYSRLPGLRALGHALDRLPRLADGAVALSARGALALGPLGAAVIPPGLFASDFAGVQPRRPNSGRWLVYAGTPDAFQGLGGLAAAMEALPGWHLLLVGPAWTARAARRVWHAAVPVSARWPSARDWIAGADVAIVPRETCAGFPMKLLNYSALGLRTVVMAGGAYGVPGEVSVEPGESTAQAVSRSLDLPRPALASVLAKWSWSSRVPALVELYDAARVTARAARS